MKKTIGLLSFHNAANYGAALQAYALERFLEDSGYECEYVDYQNEFRRHCYDMGFLIKDSVRHARYFEAIKYFLGAPFLNYRKKKFLGFYKKYVKYSSRTYFDSQALKETNALYDCFITGSDQIWNPEHNGADVNFLLDFVDDNSKKISYSSSMSISKVPEYLVDGYKRCLSEFLSLSTREESGVKLIKSLTGRDANLVLDPVFLITRKKWEELFDCKLSPKPYLFSYTNRREQMSMFLSTGYNMRGLNHYKLSRYTTPLDFVNPKTRVKYTMSPIDFLQSIYYAEMVVSASFHCISFCILFNKPFVCFLTGDEGKDERLKTLLSTFGLMDRVYSDRMTLYDVMSQIDYESVNAILDSKRQSSIDYLMESLNNSYSKHK